MEVSGPAIEDLKNEYIRQNQTSINLVAVMNHYL